MEECEFDEALKDFQSLMDDYEIVSSLYFSLDNISHNNVL